MFKRGSYYRIDKNIDQQLEIEVLSQAKLNQQVFSDSGENKKKTAFRVITLTSF